jgi:hypothetical protein
MLRRMSSSADSHDVRRKLVGLRPGLLQALELLARDAGTSLDALAEEAFTDLLRKYHRPVSLKEALKESTRLLPANDDAPPKRHGT